jgi:hypothetical protein
VMADAAAFRTVVLTFVGGINAEPLPRTAF